MSGAISFFDLRARNRRRDELVEAAIEDIRVLKPLLTDDADLRNAVSAIEALKKLRRSEVVADLESKRMAKARGPQEPWIA